MKEKGGGGGGEGGEAGGGEQGSLGEGWPLERHRPKGWTRLPVQIKLPGFVKCGTLMPPEQDASHVVSCAISSARLPCERAGKHITHKHT